MDEAAEEHQNEQWQRLADLVQEAGMLRHTPRTGWAFLGTNRESVAEHMYRTSVLGFILAKLAGAEVATVVHLCLFHDLHEARTGDFNYVYHRYDTARAREAVEHAAQGSGLEAELLAFFDEFHAKESLEARLANDADQLDLIANLNVELHKGNEFAREWLDSACQRLTTKEGRLLAEAILRRDPNAWWYDQVPRSWWVNHR